MQVRIIPKPKEENNMLEVLRILGMVTYEDQNRIVLQFDNKVCLKKLTKKYPELGDLIFRLP
jgi:hypothetical protein